MNYFINVNRLSELERVGNWNGAKKLLYDLWLANKEDVDLTIRLGTECWYVLTEWEFIETNNLSYESFQNTLKEVTNYGLEIFKEDNKFLSVFGYMIVTFPFLFGEDELYEKLGKGILKDAYLSNPNNFVSKILYLGSNTDMKEYVIAIKEEIDKIDLNQLFNGNTAIEIYFREVIFNTGNVMGLE